MKQKTKKAALKRIKKVKNNFLRKKSFKSHLLVNKSKKKLRKLNQKTAIRPSDLKKYKKMLPFI